MVDSLKKNQETRDELGSETVEQQPTFVFSETTAVHERTLQVKSRNIDNSWIAGSSTNAIVGAWTGTAGGGQLVVGPTNNTETVLAVVNPNKVFVEEFFHDTFIDSSNTTATVDTSTNFRVDFTSGQKVTSNIIFKQGTTQILTANLSATFTGSLLFEVSNDGGATWDEITPTTDLNLTPCADITNSFPLTFPITLAGSCNPELLWRATEDAASTATLSDVRIAYNQ